MTTLVAHVPSPQPGETLSSLLLRLAHNHSASGHELCVLLWPTLQFWTRDIDRTAPDALLHQVSRVTGIRFDALERTTLRDVVKATGFKDWIQGCQRGILPVGVYHRVRRRFGQQYCSACLAAKPHFLRRLWRLEFMVACPIHGSLLRDSCPSCNAPFTPHRKQSLTNAECHKCGASLITREGTSAEDPALRLQLAVLFALSGTLVDAEEALHTHTLTGIGGAFVEDIGPMDFLDGVHRMCRLAARKSSALVAIPAKKNKTWALLRTSERAAVMGEVGRWLLGWPDAWVQWAAMSDLTQHYLAQEFGPWPCWVKTAIDRLPYSHGPVNIRRRRLKVNFRRLRDDYETKGAYREARAGLLIRKAGVLNGADR